MSVHGDPASTGIRTADAVTGPLSAQEQQALLQHQQQWESRHLRTQPLDRVAVGSAIAALYRTAGLPRPRIVLVSSPGALALAATLASYIWKRRQGEPGYRPQQVAALPPVQDCRDDDLRRGTAAAVLAAVASDGSALWPDPRTADDVRELTLAAAFAPADAASANAMDRACIRAVQAVEADLHDVRHAVDDAMRDPFNNGTLTPLMARTALPIGLELARGLLPDAAQAETAMGPLGNWFVGSDGGNLACYWSYQVTAARDVLGLRLPEHAAFEPWERCAKDAGLRYMHSQFCLVADFPVASEDKNETGHTLGTGRRRYRWRDGWEV